MFSLILKNTVDAVAKTNPKPPVDEPKVEPKEKHPDATRYQKAAGRHRTETETEALKRAIVTFVDAAGTEGRTVREVADHFELTPALIQQYARKLLLDPNGPRIQKMQVMAHHVKYYGVSVNPLDLTGSPS